MTIAVAILFSIAVLAGLSLFVLRLLGRVLPVKLAVLHGIFSSSGLIALTVSVGRSIPDTAATFPLVIFEIAAVGGVFLFSFHMRGLKLPILAIAIHGALASLGFILLLSSTT